MSFCVAVVAFIWLQGLCVLCFPMLSVAAYADIAPSLHTLLRCLPGNLKASWPNTWQKPLRCPIHFSSHFPYYYPAVGPESAIANFHMCFSTLLDSLQRCDIAIAGLGFPKEILSCFLLNLTHLDFFLPVAVHPLDYRSSLF